MNTHRYLLAAALTAFALVPVLAGAQTPAANRHDHTEFKTGIPSPRPAPADEERAPTSKPGTDASRPRHDHTEFKTGIPSPRPAPADGEKNAAAPTDGTDASRPRHDHTEFKTGIPSPRPSAGGQ